MGCDERPSGVDFVEFDFGVNSGVARSSPTARPSTPRSSQARRLREGLLRQAVSFLHGLRTWSVPSARAGAAASLTWKPLASAWPLGASGKPVAPVLKNEATKNAGKAIGHSTAGASTVPPLAPCINQLDFSTVAGWIIAGLVVLGVIWFAWHAVQANHRANAYNDKLKNA
jgi:hypothetical protein